MFGADRDRPGRLLDPERVETLLKGFRRWARLCVWARARAGAMRAGILRACRLRRKL